MPKKTKSIPPYTGQLFEPGTPCRILRPNLNAGDDGIVVSVSDTTGIHRVKIDSRDGVAYPHFFHADIPGNLLDVYV